MKCGPIDVPARTTLLIDFRGMHSGKIFGEETNRFSPDRFLSESGNEIKVNEFPMTPFSMGNRKCPLFQVTPRLFKLILTHIVINFELNCTNNQNNEVEATLTRISRPLDLQLRRGT